MVEGDSALEDVGVVGGVVGGGIGAGDTEEIAELGEEEGVVGAFGGSGGGPAGDESGGGVSGRRRHEDGSKARRWGGGCKWRWGVRGERGGLSAKMRRREKLKRGLENCEEGKNQRGNRREFYHGGTGARREEDYEKEESERRNGAPLFVVEESGEHASESECSGFSVAEHGFAGGGIVAEVGAWAQPNEGRELVAHGERVGPKSSGASVAVGKGVDAHPFRVRPSAGFDDSGKQIRGQGSAGRDAGVQVLCDLPERGFELSGL